MERNILSKREDEIFSERVIAYNQSRKKDEKEKEYIKMRTKSLVYRICKELLFLDDDMISSIYISVHEDMDGIISSYRIAQRSFNHYLKQVCIYRLRRTEKKERPLLYLEREYCLESDKAYSIDTSDDDDDDEASPLSICDMTKYSGMGMKELSDYIIKNKEKIEHDSKNKKEDTIQKRLDESKYFRRNFLFFILSLPLSNSKRDAENYARIFNTDEYAFIKLLDLKRDIIEEKSEKRDKNLELAAKHWRLMAKIKNSMFKAESKEQYSVMKDNYMAQVKCHRNRLRDAMRLQKGIIHSEIASYLGHSRTTVTMGIKQVRDTLLNVTECFSG